MKLFGKDAEQVSNEDVVENVEANADAVIRVIAYDCETGYAIEDGENVIPCDKIVDDHGREVIHLPSNSTTRQWADKKKVDAAIEECGGLELTYKARVKIGSTGTKIPNETLVAKYAPELLDEFRSIVNAAIEAKKADKAAPLSVEEKLKAQIAKLQAKLDNMEGGNN